MLAMSDQCESFRQHYDRYLKNGRDKSSTRALAKVLDIAASWLHGIPPASYEDLEQKRQSIYSRYDAGSSGHRELQTREALADVLEIAMKSKYSKVVPFANLNSILNALCPDAGVPVMASIEHWNSTPRGRNVLSDDPNVGFNMAIEPLSIKNFNIAVRIVSKLQANGCSAIVTVLRPEADVMLYALEAREASGNSIQGFDRASGGASVTVTEELFNQLYVCDPRATTQHGEDLHACSSFEETMREVRAMLNVEESMILVGNPGTGKSTLMNCYSGEVLFKSGMSKNGRGVTFEFDEKFKDGKRYMDTPGLADIKKRKEAANAIDQALQVGGDFQIMFVMTLESGRVKPDDLTTMKLVFDAANQITENSYGILINMCSKNYLLDQEQKGFPLLDVLHATMTEKNIPTTKHIHFEETQEELEEEENALVQMPNVTRAFFDYLPVISIETEKVREVQYQMFEDYKVEMEAKLMECKEAMQKSAEEVKKNREMVEEAEKKVRELRDREPTVVYRYSGGGGGGGGAAYSSRGDDADAASRAELQFYRSLFQNMYGVPAPRFNSGPGPMFHGGSRSLHQAPLFRGF